MKEKSQSNFANQTADGAFSVQKKPIYQKWWFILLALIIVVWVGGKIFGGKSTENVQNVVSEKAVSSREMPSEATSSAEETTSSEAESEVESVAESKAETGSKTESKAAISSKAESKVESTVSQNEPVSSAISESKAAESKTENDENGMRKDFIEAMNSYESYMDEYVAFMKKYEASDGTDLTLLSDYAKMMVKYSEMCEKFEKWQTEDMNKAETAYYLDVQNRVNKKLLEVAS